ncbi:TetR/AcrR family transcriptional regulator [Gordonia caeni]|uniref:HTH tetR-type domain-containing protein n=1 Tax=Gordonia caeni TaxID=1007097 RepID=A0ABP7PM64_9ACTN
MDDDPPGQRRRGRPRQDELAARRSAMLDAAAAILVENGYQDFTVSAVAARAGTSKSTVYSWFDNRDGLLRAVIERNYDNGVSPLHADLLDEADPRTVLIAVAEQLVPVLQSELSLALSRAAMSDPTLRPTLLAGGGDRGRPALAAYMARAAAAGHLNLDDPLVGAKIFYGLLMQDDQIRTLLGDSPMDRETVAARARFATDAFLKLYGSD